MQSCQIINHGVEAMAASLVSDHGPKEILHGSESVFPINGQPQSLHCSVIEDWPAFGQPFDEQPVLKNVVAHVNAKAAQCQADVVLARLTRQAIAIEREFFRLRSRPRNDALYRSLRVRLLAKVGADRLVP